MKVINIVYCLSQNEKVNEKKEKSGRLVTLFTSNEARVSVANLQQLINCIRFRNLKCRARDRATDFQVWRLIDREFLHSSSPCSPLSPLSTSPEGSSSSFFFFFYFIPLLLLLLFLLLCVNLSSLLQVVARRRESCLSHQRA